MRMLVCSGDLDRHWTGHEDGGSAKTDEGAEGDRGRSGGAEVPKWL